MRVKMVDLSEYVPVIQSNEIQVPGFLEGDFGRQFFDRYEEHCLGNPNFKIVQEGRGLIGSNVLVSGLFNYVFSEFNSRFRTPVFSDDLFGNIYTLVRDDSCHTFLNSLYVNKREIEESNLNILDQIVELVKERQGVEFPFVVEGFYCIPDDSLSGYGVRIEPAKNFEVISGEEFENKLKEVGLSWYGPKTGLEGICLSRTCLRCEEDLAYKMMKGKTLVVSAD